MSIKLSIFTTVGNTGTKCYDWQDPWKEALKCYYDLADELVVVDGGLDSPDFDWIFPIKVQIKRNEWYKQVFHRWPEEFSWEFIGEQFQRGYEACTGDWVIHADLDFFFHENDFTKLREILEANNDKPALSLWKFQFLLVDRYRLKSRLVVAVNKGKFGDRIKFNSGGDLCQPSLDGMELKPDAVPEARIPFYNYDFSFKDKETISREFHRMAKARNKVFPNDDWGIASEKDALEKFKRLMVGRFRDGDGYSKLKLEEHPKYIQEFIKNLTPDKFGYEAFGWLNDKAEYFK